MLTSGDFGLAYLTEFKYASRSAIAGTSICFSSPSGMYESPVLRSSSTWWRSTVSSCPSGWRIVGVIMPSIDPTSQQPTALDFEDEQQIRSFQAYMSRLQNVQGNVPQSIEPQQPAAETAAKPDPQGKQTTKQ